MNFISYTQIFLFLRSHHFGKCSRLIFLCIIGYIIIFRGDTTIPHRKIYGVATPNPQDWRQCASAWCYKDLTRQEKLKGALDWGVALNVLLLSYSLGFLTGKKFIGGIWTRKPLLNTSMPYTIAVWLPACSLTLWILTICLSILFWLSACE